MSLFVQIEPFSAAEHLLVYIYVWYETFRVMNISRLKKKNRENREKYMHVKIYALQYVSLCIHVLFVLIHQTSQTRTIKVISMISATYKYDKA